jgi:Pyridoxamine 5'-phosphate oxidase
MRAEPVSGPVNLAPSGPPFSHVTRLTVHARSPISMRLTTIEARARLAAHDHGVLCTVHAERGVDPVPVVYVVDEDGWVGVPVDRVKPKSASRLQRERNLEADPRAALLVEHWDREDWSRLWWVRAELRWQEDPPAARVANLAARLALAFRQYNDQPFTRVLVLRVVGVGGWVGDQ